MDEGFGYILSWLIVSIRNSFTDREKAPVTAFVLGVISLLITWILPLITIPLPILGLILSIRGKNSSQRKWAIAAGVMCVLSLALNLVVVLGLVLLALAGS